MPLNVDILSGDRIVRDTVEKGTEQRRKQAVWLSGYLSEALPMMGSAGRSGRSECQVGFM